MNDIKKVLTGAVNFVNDTKGAKKSKVLKVSDVPSIKPKLLSMTSL